MGEASVGARCTLTVWAQGVSAGEWRGLVGEDSSAGPQLGAFAGSQSCWGLSRWSCPPLRPLPWARLGPPPAPRLGTNAPSGQGQSFRNEGNDPISGYPSSSVIFPWAGEQRS